MDQRGERAHISWTDGVVGPLGLGRWKSARIRPETRGAPPSQIEQWNGVLVSVQLCVGGTL